MQPVSIPGMFQLFSLLLFLCSTHAASTGQYTYTLISSVAGCPTLIPTATLTTLSALGAGQYAPTAFAQSDGSIIPQVEISNYKGQTVTFQTSNTSRMVLFSTSGQSAILDNDGVRVYPSDCSSMLLLPIPNLISALNKSASNTKRSNMISDMSSLEKRAARSSPSIPITIDYLDQCGHPVTGHTAAIDCIISFGNGTSRNTKHTLQAAGSPGFYQGACTYPDTSAAKAQCIQQVSSALLYPTQGLAGQLSNIDGYVTALSVFLKTGVAGKLAAKTLLFFARREVAVASGFLSLYGAVVTQFPSGVSALADALCFGFNVNILQVAARLDVEHDFVDVDYQIGQPFTFVSVTRTVSMQSTTCSTSVTPTSTACNYQGGICNTYKQCGSSNDCLCGQDTTGYPICFDNADCSTYGDCSTNADCASGQKCLNNKSCCARSVCTAVDVCSNPASTKRVFKSQGRTMGFAPKA